MANVTKAATIQASPDTVWKTVRDFGSDDVVEMVEGLYAMAFDGLKQLHDRSASLL